MLIPEQQKFLLHVSEVFLANIITYVIGAMCLGATATLHFCALWLIRKQESQGYAVKIVVTAATIGFMASVADFDGNIAFDAIYYQTFADKSSYGPGVKPEAVVQLVNMKAAKVNLIRTLAQYLNLGISDALVLWRTQALYPDLPRSLIMIMTTTLVVSSVCLFLVATGLFYQNTDHLDGIGNIIWSTAQTVSFLTNVATTFLVGSKLWRHRRWLNTHLADLDMGFSPIQKKILLMVETGLAFCLIQGAMTIMGWSTFWESFYGSQVYYLVRILQFGFAANYTPILLILLQTKTSVTDSLCILNDPVQLGDQPIELSAMEFPEFPTYRDNDNEE